MARTYKEINSQFEERVRQQTGASIEFTSIGDRFSILADTAQDMERARRLLDQGFEFIEQQDYPEESMWLALYKMPN